MLPTNPYLISRAFISNPPHESLKSRNSHRAGAARSTWAKSALATSIALLATIAAAAPSWAGPAGGC